MYQMSGLEYQQIFKENQLIRSELVRLLEAQIKILQENQLHSKAEETKWLAITIAEDEKKQRYGYLEQIHMKSDKGATA